MADLPQNMILTHHAADEAAQFLDELCEAYADAYGEVSGEIVGVKSNAFRERALAATDALSYGLVTARIDGGLIGFAFGYSLRPERGWWDGLNPEPPEGFAAETGSRTAVLAEIEVRRAWQGKGVGRTLHDAFLASRSEERATLASNSAATEMHALYEKWGWQRVGVVPGKPASYYREYVRFVFPLPASSEPR